MNNHIIKVTRLKKVFGFAIPFELYIDDEKIGSLSNGKSFDKEVSEGVHKVVIKSVENNFEQEVSLDDEHKNVEITLTAKMGLIAARPNIKEVRYY